MGRLVVLVLLVVAAVWLVRRALRQGANATGMTKKTEELVSCARCGVLLPRPEARASGGGLYCSDEHARLGPGTR
ncbi:MAG TPA: PP0621 family protein [Burkholderiales bacterium]|nr:PP0621 family protein [Burkholderiales bacterium]